MAKKTEAESAAVSDAPPVTMSLEAAARARDLARGAAEAEIYGLAQRVASGGAAPDGPELLALLDRAGWPPARWEALLVTARIREQAREELRAAEASAALAEKAAAKLAKEREGRAAALAELDERVRAAEATLASARAHAMAGDQARSVLMTSAPPALLEQRRRLMVERADLDRQIQALARAANVAQTEAMRAEGAMELLALGTDERKRAAVAHESAAARARRARDEHAAAVQRMEQVGREIGDLEREMVR